MRLRTSTRSAFGGAKLEPRLMMRIRGLIEITSNHYKTQSCKTSKQTSILQASFFKPKEKKIDQLQPILNLLAVDLFFSWPPPPSAVSQMLWVFRAGGTSEAGGAAAIPNDL